MTENFGAYLKNERELRGVPLQEIADNTNIPIRFLQALEENNLNELPEEVFIKGYIRSYTRSIGTNADEVLTAFNLFAVQEREKKKQQQLKRGRGELFMKRQKNRRTVLWVLVSMIVLLTIGYLSRLTIKQDKPVSQSSIKKDITLNTKLVPLENSSNEKSTPIKTGEGKKEDITISTSINMPTSEPLPESEPKSDSKNISLQQAKLVDSTFLDPVANIPKANSENLTKQHETATGIEFGRKNDIIPGAQKTPLTNPQLLELTIKTEEHSWFELLIDGTRVEDFILPAGTGKTFKGKESFKITIGNRNGTRLLLNGTALVLPKSPPTEKDVVRNFLIQTKLLN